MLPGSACSAVLLRDFCRVLAPARNRPQLPDQLDDRRADRDKNNRRQNKYHQWGDHLDGGLCSLFFGPLPAFRAEGVGMHAQGLGDAGAEAIGLNQCTNQGTDVVNPGSVDQVAEGFGAGLAGAHLEVDQMEFIAEIGMGVVQILAHAHQGLVEGESGFDADDGQVEGIGQAEANAMLPVFDHALEDEARQEKAEAGNADEKKKIVEAGKQRDAGEPDGSHQKASAEIVVDVDGIAESGLNQPGAGAGNVGRRKRNGLAERVERLLDAFPQRGLVLRPCCCCPPRARKRAPSTELGVTTAAPKAKTAITTVTNTTMIRTEAACAIPASLNLLLKPESE